MSEHEAALWVEKEALLWGNALSDNETKARAWRVVMAYIAMKCGERDAYAEAAATEVRRLRAKNDRIAELLGQYPPSALLTGLENIQRTLCSYDGFNKSRSSDGAPRMCDCKYGAATNPKNIGKGHEEACGCPELRMAIAVLREVIKED